MVWQIQPATTYDARVTVLDHPASRDPTEQTCAAQGTDGNEVRTRPRVVVAFQPHAATACCSGCEPCRRPSLAGLFRIVGICVSTLKREPSTSCGRRTGWSGSPL